MVAEKYYCSVCLIIRDENEYLQEWLEWHIGQGIQHFYIYDHGSKQPVKDFIKTLDGSVAETVTVIDFGGRHAFAQHEAYNDCLERFGAESRWIGFIDSDEFVKIKNGKSMTEFLKDYEQYGGLFIGWVVYNAGGQVKKSALPVTQRFTVKAPPEIDKGLGKTFAQSRYMLYMLTHNGYMRAGYPVVDENKNAVKEADLRQPDLTTDLICVNHYYTKSYQEWVEKLSRGSCDPYYFRKYYDFFSYNPDMTYCNENRFPVQEYEISKKQ